ncbi:MAG TPA: methyltransferase domain-containing protein [Candidatus Eisenbacteria bacterium]|nr:methyltransferase domain-containing protein [Candidatus Eisenbacteria bacterium]
MSDADAGVRAAWDANAAFWDARMGEGNRFVNVLVWPATERLLALRPGERVLDVACGNGLAARRIASLGAEVTAFDFAPGMIRHARERSGVPDERIRYRVLDATDREALRGLGGGWDAVHCGMALFDMSDLEPLAQALPELLAPGGRFVFSLLHPCFSAMTAELFVDESGPGIRVRHYMTPVVRSGEAIVGQPVPHPYFERPLSLVLAPFLRAGLVLDGLEERSFSSDAPRRDEGIVSWSGQFSEIPPVLVARMRPAAAAAEQS